VLGLALINENEIEIRSNGTDMKPYSSPDPGIQFEQRLGEVISRVGEEDFWSSLSQHLKAFLPCDSLVAMVYSDNLTPVILHNEVKETNDRAFENIYLQGAYLLSPLYQCHKQRSYGFFSLSDIVPEGFYQSEYYSRYYSLSGLLDQFVMVIKVAQEQSLVISMGLLSGSYQSKETAPLKQLAPVISPIISKHWQFSQSAIEPLNNQLQKAFDLFGSSVLTDRERAVIHTLMKGHSSKSTARELGISVETERSYRKSAYAKLNVGSQSELFNLFFNSLKFADQVNEQDPLSFLG